MPRPARTPPRAGCLGPSHSRTSTSRNDAGTLCSPVHCRLGQISACRDIRRQCIRRTAAAGALARLGGFSMRGKSHQISGTRLTQAVRTHRESHSFGPSRLSGPDRQTGGKMSGCGCVVFDVPAQVPHAVAVAGGGRKDLCVPERVNACARPACMGRPANHLRSVSSSFLSNAICRAGFPLS